MRVYEKRLITKDEAIIKLQKLDSIARYNRNIIEDARQIIEGGQ